MWWIKFRTCGLGFRALEHNRNFSWSIEEVIRLATKFFRRQAEIFKILFDSFKLLSVILGPQRLSHKVPFRWPSGVSQSLRDVLQGPVLVPLKRTHFWANKSLANTRRISISLQDGTVNTGINQELLPHWGVKSANVCTDLGFFISFSSSAFF